MTTVAFSDNKPYDRAYFERAAGADKIRWQFHEFRLSSETATAASGASAVGVFVNDRLDAPDLEALQRAGGRLVALRCADFNNVVVTITRRGGIPDSQKAQL